MPNFACLPRENGTRRRTRNNKKKGNQNKLETKQRQAVAKELVTRDRGPRNQAREVRGGLQDRDSDVENRRRRVLQETLEDI